MRYFFFRVLHYIIMYIYMYIYTEPQKKRYKVVFTVLFYKMRLHGLFASFKTCARWFEDKRQN